VLAKPQLESREHVTASCMLGSVVLSAEGGGLIANREGGRKEESVSNRGMGCLGLKPRGDRWEGWPRGGDTKHQVIQYNEVRDRSKDYFSRRIVTI